MGSAASNLRERIQELRGRKAVKILTVGLDAAGKTTMFYKMMKGRSEEVVTTIPTIGFHVETLEFGHGNLQLDMTLWDIGGRTKLRPLWRHYYPSTTGLIFVVDANDHDRMEEACDELHRMASEEVLAGVPVLIFANKQDLPRAMSAAEIVERFNMRSLRCRWLVQESVATEGKGLDAGLRWLFRAMGTNSNVSVHSDGMGAVQCNDQQPCLEPLHGGGVTTKMDEGTEVNKDEDKPYTDVEEAVVRVEV